jgi:hypothetical protein
LPNWFSILREELISLLFAAGAAVGILPVLRAVLYRSLRLPGRPYIGFILEYAGTVHLRALVHLCRHF